MRRFGRWANGVRVRFKFFESWNDRGQRVQRTVDYPDEWANGFHVMLDSGKLVMVRWNAVEGSR